MIWRPFIRRDRGPRPLTWVDVLAEEDRALLGASVDAYEAVPGDDERARTRAMIARLHSRKRSALCLSGGGVRSATFALGVMQGLANIGVLRPFDYLSTVSGGGYIGGWFTTWLHRQPERSLVLTTLDPESGVAANSAEATPVERVRDTCRYLAPDGGLLSADVWTLLATLGRNLLLNWLVLLPLVAAALLVPRAYYALVKLIEVTRPVPQCWAIDQPQGWLLAISLVAFVVQTGYIALNFAGRGGRWTQQRFLTFVLAPVLVGSTVFTLFWASYPCDLNLTALNFAVALVPAAGWLIFGALARPSIRTAIPAVAALVVVGVLWEALPVGDVMTPFGRLGSADIFGVPEVLVGGMALVVLGILNRKLSRARVGVDLDVMEVLASERTVGAAFISGPILGVGLYFFITHYFPFRQDFTEGYAIVAVPSILLIWTLATVMFIGLASEDFTDAALEWWSRCGAWVSIAAVAWLVASLLVFKLAYVFELGVRAAHSRLQIGDASVSSLVIVLIPLLSSLAGLVVRTPSSPAKRSPIRELLQKIGLPLIIIVLLSAIGWADGRLVGAFDVPVSVTTDVVSTTAAAGDTTESSQAGTDDEDSSEGLGALPQFWRVLLVGGVLVGVGLVMSRYVPVNRFSLHGMYRQRLVRTFLGASNPRRDPNAFTGFDPHDDIRIHELSDVRPLHIVNTTLNALSATDVGRNERSAQSFTFSPLHVGSVDLGYRPARHYGSDGGASATGVSLGLALAVSGAAASPAMGIYSSKSRAFLLTLANARLGLWFGNPSDAVAWSQSEPALGVGPLLREMLGLTTESNPHVYLSDGGHFENLGLYEMVARRCHFIVVSDAGCDPEYAFDDLANAIRRIRIDFGIPIEFPDFIPARVGEGHHQQHAAVGVIRYSAVDGQPGVDPATLDGTIVYLKPVLSGDEPVDVRNFAQGHTAFPHDPTSDQFFDEARFESYRSLGFHTVKTLARGFRGTGEPADVERFCSAARSSLGSVAPMSPRG